MSQLVLFLKGLFSATRPTDPVMPDDVITGEQGMQSPLSSAQRALLRYQIGTRWEMIHRLHALEPVPDRLRCALCDFAAERAAFVEWVTECIFEGGNIVRHQCPACEVIFGSDVMLNLSPEALSREYEWHYQVFSEGDSTEQEIRAFRALNPERGRAYVNWGSGAWSSSIEQLRAEGWEVFGYEPHGSAHGGGNHVLTTRGELERLKPAGIFSNNVLEHLRHPVSSLREMVSLLPSGSLMSHATPCFEYRFEFTRFHLFFFLGRSRSLLARRAGLQIESYQVEGDFMNLVLS
ncbi:MAG: hypothetical protein O2981_06325, partial [Proteobacteria bacterium]|nr:hypothetical protein [Pseudomonadota bacterium]